MKKVLMTFLAVASVLTAGAQPILVGHRGSGYGVESTEEAFRRGAALGYEYVESDLKVTRDKRFVLSHDDNTTRLGGKLTIATSSLEQLQSETLTQTRNGVKYTGKLMSLEDWLVLCEELDIKPLIELKWATGVNNNDCSNIPLLIETLDYYGFRDKCIIMTSMKPCLEYIHKNYPDIELQFLTGEYWANHFDWCVENGIGADIQAGFFDKNTVTKYHNAGLKVNMWTTNDEAGYRKYAGWGCDFITTDRLDAATLPIIVPPAPEPTPQEVDLVWERLWIASNTTDNAPEHIDGTNAQQGTAVNGLFYVNDCADKLIYVFKEGQLLGTLEGGAGWGCCRDDKGNIIVRDDKLTGNKHTFIIYPAGATPEDPGRVRRVEVEVPVAGQTNFINASGDVLSEEGGYIYLFPKDATTANIVDIALGNFIEAKESAKLMLTGTAAGYIIPTECSLVNWYYQIRNTGIYFYRGETSDDFSSGGASIKAPERNSTGGAAIFKIKDNRIFIHNSGSNYKGGFTVRNHSLGTIITTVEPIGKLGYEEGGNYSTFNWLIAEEQRYGEWYIYQYCPSNGMAAYRLYDRIALGIYDTATDDAELQFDGRSAVINGIPATELVQVYTLSGACVATGTAAYTDLSNLQAGIYVLNAGGKAFKVSVK